jgi:uncharacterized protein
MDLKEKLSADYKEAMKARDKLRVSTIRLILAEVKNAEIAKRGELDEEELGAVIAREARRRREAIEEFGKGGRQDLVDKETYELSVIEAYLPQQLSPDEVRSLAEEAIREVGAGSPADIGKVMGKLMPQLKGRADGKQVNQMVREMLQ